MNNSLDRFLIAQEHSYDTALREIRSGRKRSHWMWYIFPQIAGLGMSYTAQLYAIKDIEEARQYIAHPVLGARLIEISNALLTLDCSDAAAVMGYPDDLKLRSCMTLFAQVSDIPCSTPFSRNSTAARRMLARLSCCLLPNAHKLTENLHVIFSISAN